MADDLAQAALFHPELKTHFRPFMPPMLLPESGRPFMSLFARFLGYEPVAKSGLKWDKPAIP